MLDAILVFGAGNKNSCVGVEGHAEMGQTRLARPDLQSHFSVSDERRIQSSRNQARHA